MENKEKPSEHYIINRAFKEDANTSLADLKAVHLRWASKADELGRRLDSEVARLKAAGALAADVSKREVAPCVQYRLSPAHFPARPAVSFVVQVGVRACVGAQAGRRPRRWDD